MKQLAKPPVPITIEAPPAMAAMIDALSRGFYGALYGKSREEIAAALLRSHLIELMQSGAYDALIQPAKRSGGG